MSRLPVFKYHPDPVATGSATPTAEDCSLCERPAEYRYVGPVYGSRRPVICLVCISDGSAAKALFPITTDDIRDEEGRPIRGGFTTTDDAPKNAPHAVLDEITLRTPGFSGWQQERWLFHCDDGAAYLGRVGWEEIKDLPDAVESLHTEWAEFRISREEATRRLEWMDREGDYTGYLFRCRHCGIHLAYSDMS